MEKIGKKGFVAVFAALVLGVFLVFSSGTAHAWATADAYSNIDWSTLSITYTGTMVQTSNLTGSVEAEANNSSGSVSNDNSPGNSLNNTSANAITPDTNAYADAWSTVGSSLGAHSNAYAQDDWGYADGAAGGYIYDLILTGAGTLTATVDYSLTTDLQTDHAGDSASADAWVGLQFGFTSFTHGVTASLTHTLLAPGQISDTNTGTLTAIFDVSGSDTGTLDFLSWATVEVNDGSQVPLPGAIWLLGSGLIGLVGLRRKSQG